VADEAFVEQHRAQVGMAAEHDAVHLVALALHHDRRAVQVADRVDGAILEAHVRGDAHAQEARRRVEVVDDVEARDAVEPVDGGHVEEQVEVEVALERRDGAANILASHRQRQRIGGRARAHRLVAEARTQQFQERGIHVSCAVPTRAADAPPEELRAR